MSVSILYKDKDLILCRKPAGMPSQPDPTGQRDLLSALTEEFGPSVGLVHRLDTPTGGVMVFGRTPQAIAQLNQSAQDHTSFQKEYLAVLSSPPLSASGELEDYLFHDQRQNKSFAVERGRKGCKRAILRYTTLETLEDGRTLVLVRLMTGRTHQIRVQFASRGMPLLGDGKYGSRHKCPYIALWSYRLTLPHPSTHEPLSASCLPPTDTKPWQEFSSLRKDIPNLSV